VGREPIIRISSSEQSQEKPLNRETHTIGRIIMRFLIDVMKGIRREMRNQK